MAKLWPQSEDAIASPYLCQTEIRKHSDAFMLALSISGVPSLEPFWRRNANIRLQRMARPLRANLRETQQWERAIQQMNRCADNWLVLKLLIADAAMGELSIELQTQLAAEMVKHLRSFCSIAKDTLLPAIVTFSTSWFTNSVITGL